MVSSKVIDLCKRGDEKGYRRLYDACIPYVYSIVTSYVSDEFYQKDIIQEIFAKVFSDIYRYDEVFGGFKYWLRKISVNFCLMHLRAYKKFSTLVPIDGFEQQIADESERFEDKISREEINQLLRSMPTGYKTIFFLIAIDGYTHEEVGKELNISSGTSRSQFLRAKHYIQTYIFNTSNKVKYGFNN